MNKYKLVLQWGSKIFLFSVFFIFLSHFNLQASPIVISAPSTTWPVATTNSDTSVSDDIYVQNGATLFLRTNKLVDVDANIFLEPNGKLYIEADATLRMGEGKRIEVQSDYTHYGEMGVIQGAILSVQTGAVITNRIGAGRWEGIKVWGMNDVGQSFKSQQYSALGYFYYARIENSVNGVTNHNGGANVYISPSIASGGQIVAVGTTFKNNISSLFMWNQMEHIGGSILSDRSRFTECTFLIEDNSLCQTPVYLLNVEGVTFAGCSFINEEPDIQAPGGAIWAYDAGFIVNDHCSSTPVYVPSWYGYSCGGSVVQSTFTGFKRGGINAWSNGTWHNIAIEHAIFTGNEQMGIQINGYPFPLVIGNSITFTGSDLSADMYKIGINILGCPHAVVENNTITADSYSGWIPPATAVNHPLCGIVMNTIGGLPNDVYKNSITGMDYAIEGIGKNRMRSGVFSGLTFLCNTMASANDVSYDIIAGEAGYPGAQTVFPTSGVAIYQQGMNMGNPAPAGNSFDSKPPASFLYRQFHNALVNYSHDIFYQYYNGNPNNEKPGYVHLDDANLSGYIGTGTAAGCSSRGWHENFAGVSTGGVIVSTGGDDEMAASATAYGEAMKQKLAWYMFRDTSVIEIDTIVALLESEPYFYEYKIMLAGAYITQARYQDAIDLLDGLHNSFDMSEDEEDWMQNLKLVYQVEKDLYDNDGDWDEVDGGLKADLEDLLTNDKFYARHWSKYYLSRYEDMEFDPEYIWEEEEGSGEKSLQASNIQLMRNQIYPNPVKDELKVHISDMKMENATICIVDIQGRLILNSGVKKGLNNINVAKLSSGMYFVKLYSNDQLVETLKLAKQ